MTRYLTEKEALELAESIEMYEYVKYAGCRALDFSHPNSRFGLPPRYKGNDLVIIDPFLHHLLPGKA